MTTSAKDLKKMKLVDLGPEDLQILADEASKNFESKKFTTDDVEAFMVKALPMIVARSGERLTSNEIREICTGSGLGDKRNGRIILQHCQCHPLVKANRDDNYRVDVDNLRSLADEYGVEMPADYVTAPDVVKVKAKATPATNEPETKTPEKTEVTA